MRGPGREAVRWRSRGETVGPVRDESGLERDDVNVTNAGEAPARRRERRSASDDRRDQQLAR
jgi:hypothetical protein